MNERYDGLNERTNLGCSITCKDLEASIRFYRDAIGFAVAQTFENEGKAVAAVVAAGNCHIVLNQDDGKLGWDRIKGQGQQCSGPFFLLAGHSIRRYRPSSTSP